MVTDSFLELFTTLFAWMWYGAIWDVMRDTGLLLLPFLGIVLDKSIQYRKYAEDGIVEESVIRGMEVEIYLAIFVILFAGAPALPLQATEVVYTPPPLYPEVLGDPVQVSAEASGTTYGTLSFVDAPESVDVPLLYYMVTAYSGGFNRAVIESIGSRQNLRYYIQQLGIARIEDPDLREEANDFYRDCHLPALSKWHDEKPQGAVVDELIETHGADDIYFLGSRIFRTLPGYYDFYRSKEIMPPFLYSLLRDVEYDPDNPPIYGKPYCFEWYETAEIGLKARILEAHGSLLDIGGIVEAGWDFDLLEDNVVKNILRNGPTEWMPRGYDYAYTGLENRELNELEAWVQVARNGSTRVGSILSGLFKDFEMHMFLSQSHQLQSLLIMGIIIFTPFVLVLSKFNLSAVIIVAWAIFSIKFFTVIWYIVAWVDQNLIAAMYPEPGMLTKLSALWFSNKAILLRQLIISLYYFLPLIFIIVSGWGGINIMNGISSLTSQLTASSRGASGALTKGVQKAISKKIGR